MKKYGVTYTQWYALSNISRKEGMTQTTMCYLLEITKGACTTLINRLIKADLVERQTSESDRREQFIFITPKGKEILEKEVDMLAEIYSETFVDFTDKALQELQDVMLGIYEKWSVILQKDEN